jgi:hypothetical protein
MCQSTYQKESKYFRAEKFKNIHIDLIFSSPRRSRISCAVVLLLFIVGSSIVALVSYHVGQNSNSKIAKEQSKPDQ